MFSGFKTILREPCPSKRMVKADCLVFLDIDGVLNSRTWPSTGRIPDRGLMGIGHFHQWQLARIIRETGCWFILSSTWRKGLHSDEGWREDLMEFGMDPRIIGRILDSTPDFLASKCRGQEIDKWLSDNNYQGPFIILDDDSDMEPHMDKLVKTPFIKGLDRDGADRAIAELNRQLACMGPEFANRLVEYRRYGSSGYERRQERKKK